MIGVLAALVLVVIVASAALFTVQQTDQVLITQFGQPIRVINEPGLHVKVPFVQTVITFDRRLLDYSTPGEEVILSDQRRVIVDSFTRFHIIDPLQYYQAVGAQEDAIRARLNSVVTSSLRRVLGNETLPAVLSTNRKRIMGLIRDQVNGEMRSFGVSIEDVRIRRVDFPEENTQAILSRMKSERLRSGRRPSVTAPCCWPMRGRQPTSCGARARTRRSPSMPPRSRRIRSSSASGGLCRPTVTDSPTGSRAW